MRWTSARSATSHGARQVSVAASWPTILTWASLIDLYAESGVHADAWFAAENEEISDAPCGNPNRLLWKTCARQLARDVACLVVSGRRWRDRALCSARSRPTHTSGPSMPPCAATPRM